MTVRVFVCLAFSLIMNQLNALAETSGKKASTYLLYVGAYTENENEGIYVYRFDASDGDLDYLTTAKGIKNPSYLAIDEKRKLLFAVNETGEYLGKKTGSVTSFGINLSDGSLNKISQVSSGGGAPCYISINASAKLALVANYSGGNISVFPVTSDGTLMEFTDLKQHEGKGLIGNRQNVPHAHSVVLSPKEDYALAADLGIDKLISYKVDPKKGMLAEQSRFALKPGSGPRHISIHPNKKLVFVINELNSTVTSCGYDPSAGVLNEIETVTTLPGDFSGENYCADIHVSQDGQFLYGSNRGHNSIVIYRIDRKSGKLSLVGHESVKGAWPRNFMMDPTGKFLLVANQHSNNIVVFKVNRETGLLKSNGVDVEVSKPVCLKMIPVQ